MAEEKKLNESEELELHKHDPPKSDKPTAVVEEPKKVEEPVVKKVVPKEEEPIKKEPEAKKYYKSK